MARAAGAVAAPRRQRTQESLKALMNLYVAQVHPSRDRYAADELRRQDFEVLMPTILDRVLSRGAVKIVDRLLFPGYLFVGWASGARWQAVNGTRGVKRLLCPANRTEPLPLNWQVVELIRWYCTEEDRGIAAAASLLGKLVIVLDGPFSGFEAACIGVEGATALLRLAVFGRQVATRVPVRLLKEVRVL